MRNGKIIVVDDNEAVLKTLRFVLSREFRTVVGVSNPTLLPALLREEDVDVVLLDMNFGTGKQTGGEGLFWLDRIQKMLHPPAVILITAFGDIELAVASLKKGASDFIVKPWDNDKLIECIRLACEKKQKENSPVLSGESVKNDTLSQELTAEELSAQLILFFLKKYVTLYSKSFPALTPEATQRLSGILWQGNIQSLEQSIERAILLNDAPILDAKDFDIDTLPESGEPPLTLDEMEKQFIREILTEKKGNLTLTAQQLNISRQTLYNKIRKYGL